ncbi:MAG TPA: efflux RND transporter permease subunit [Terriglobales bacterium]|nr:efflux RND transporter permease subunit [Terriglobales bacterium]
MKRWVSFVLTHRLLFLLFAASLFALSFFFVRDLNVEAFPDPSPAIVEVVTIYEGKSAEEVERQITVPLEIGLAGMQGQNGVNSISLYGLSDIKCNFTYGTSYKEAKQQVINRIANIGLPENARPSIIPSMVGEVMRYRVEGSNNLMELRTLQDWTVARHLKTADGVEDVGSWGGYIKAYVVTVHPENLIKYAIPLSQVIDSMEKSNLNVGGRVVEMGDQYYMVRGLGLIRSREDIENTLVASKNGQVILVRNVGEVSVANIPRTGIVGLGAQDDVVMGIVLLRKDAKSIPSIKSLHEKMGELNSRILPSGIKVVPFYERWDLINTVVRKVIETATGGIFLVAVALLFFLGNFRAAVITALVIPISLAITLALMALRGESANLLSIGAIDFGIIVDIPLILIEDYFRISKTRGPGNASVQAATEEVARPMFFSVGIIFLAFIPIFLMKGAEAQVFSPMAKTYFYTILLTLSLTFTYLIAGKAVFLSKARDHETRLLAAVRDKYVGLVAWLVGRRRQTIAVAVLVVGAGLVFGFRSIGTQFLPVMDEGNIYIRIMYPYTISLKKSNEYANVARRYMAGIAEVETVESQTGRPEDGTDPSGPFNTEYCLILKPYKQWRPGWHKPDLEEQIRGRLRTMFPNADITITQYSEDQLHETMSGVKGENSVKIFGEDLAVLEDLAAAVSQKLAETPGIEDVGVLRELGQPNLLIDVVRENAAAIGLTMEDILDTVSAALGGKEISRVIEGSKNFSLLVRYPTYYGKEPEKITNSPIVLPNGGVIPLSRVASVHYDTGASFIYRGNYRRYIPVKFAVTSKDMGGTVRRAQEKVSRIKVPDGYYMEWSGVFREMKESFKRLFVSLPLSIFLILVVLYVLFQSVRNVMITMVAPLLAVFAGLMGLLVARESLSVSSMVGFISIIGVSVLNSSILVAYYLGKRRKGLGSEEAVLATARDKFRPVLMGGVVAALGLLPASLARGVGSQIQRPLAIVVVAGMSLGMTLILMIMPLLLGSVEVENRRAAGRPKECPSD